MVQGQFVGQPVVVSVHDLLQQAGCAPFPEMPTCGAKCRPRPAEPLNKM